MIIYEIGPTLAKTLSDLGNGLGTAFFLGLVGWIVSRWWATP